MVREDLGRHPIAQSRNPFTCGLTGASYTQREVLARSEYLARALANDLQWDPNLETPWDKVICIFSLNSVCKTFDDRR